MRQRGFGTLAYLLAGIALVGALGGLYALVDGRGYARGAAAKQVEWDRANDQAEKEKWERAKAVSQALADADTERAAAAARASNATTRWQEAKRELERKGTALAVCQADTVGDGVAAAGEPAAPAVADPVHHRPGVGIRLTVGFVRLYDGAWTGPGGEPVFPAAAGGEGTAGAGAASPYSVADVLAVHGENAKRCSEDRRELGALMDKLKAVAKAWDAKAVTP